MEFSVAWNHVLRGRVMTRTAWSSRGFAVGLANDPISGVSTPVLTRGDQLWLWRPSDKDKVAADWKFDNGENDTYLGHEPREVL